MAKVKQSSSTEDQTKRRPARTPEEMENRLIALAYDAVEERIRNGSATSQELVHFLRLGSQRERVEQDILEKKKELIIAKTEAMESAKRVEALYEDAMAAFTKYRGEDDAE